MINLIYETETEIPYTFTPEDLLYSSFAIAIYLLFHVFLYKFGYKIPKKIKSILMIPFFIAGIFTFIFFDSVPGVVLALVFIVIAFRLSPFHLSVRNMQDTRDAENFCKVNADFDNSQKNKYDEFIRQGKFFYNEGNYSKACDRFVDSIKINPISDEAWYMIGVINFNRQMYKEAKKALYTALINNENHVEAKNLYNKLKQMEAENKTDND